jgi:hypothetical protein
VLISDIGFDVHRPAHEKDGHRSTPHSRHRFQAFEIIAVDQHAAFAAVIAFENFSEFG